MFLEYAEKGNSKAFNNVGRFSLLVNRDVFLVWCAQLGHS